MLTLKGATVAGVAAQYGAISLDATYAIYAEGELKLVLVDTNTVYSGTGADVRAGIHVNYLDAPGDGSLTIEGDGLLHAYATAGGNRVHDGILVSGSLTINSGTITAEGNSTNGNSFGVRAVTNFVMNGGTLTATGGNVTGGNFSWGVSASGAVTINGGTVTATGGTVTATGGTGSSSFGISSTGIAINASTNGAVSVTAKTTDTSTQPHRAFNRSPVISDGAVYTWSLTENNSNPTPSAPTPYSWENSQTFTELTLSRAVAMPAISPAEGAYTDPQSVELTGDTGATIHYTTDGTEPTEASTAFVAGTPIAVSATTTIKARAFKANMSASAVAQATYTFPREETSSSGGPSVYYKGGNTFGASRSDAPTEVLINNAPVAFSANGGVITVSGMPAGANWVTVKWGSTSASTNFTPNGAVTAIANVELPKTGDASVIAMALCGLAAAAAMLKKR